MQYAMGIPPALRGNIDYVFILKESVLANRKKLYDQYAGVFPNFDVFCQAMDQCTNDFQCLVIDNTTNSNVFEEQVYWYKASPKGNFKMGCERYWEYSEKKFDENYGKHSGYVNMNSKKKKNYMIKQVKH